MLYRIQNVPGKGRGAVAVDNISRGTLVLSEKPLFKIPSAAYGEAEASHQIALQLKRLEKIDQRRYFDLQNDHRSLNPILGIAKTNAIPLGTNAMEGGIFPSCSRFNHSCGANAAYSWNARKNEERVYALEDIQNGEEITVNYVPETVAYLPKDERRKRINQEYGFLCVCALCTADVETVLASDKRRSELAKLEATVGDGITIVVNPNKALGCARLMLQCLSAEGEEDMKAHSAYYDAFQICVTHGDFARAVAFADLAARVKAVCQGDDAEGIEELRQLARLPEKHRLAGTTRKWQSMTRQCRSKDDADFDSWLWRRAS